MMDPATAAFSDSTSPHTVEKSLDEIEGEVPLGKNAGVYAGIGAKYRVYFGI